MTYDPTLESVVLISINVLGGLAGLPPPPPSRPLYRLTPKWAVLTRFSLFLVHHETPGQWLASPFFFSTSGAQFLSFDPVEPRKVRKIMFVTGTGPSPPTPIIAPPLRRPFKLPTCPLRRVRQLRFPHPFPPPPPPPILLSRRRSKAVLLYMTTAQLPPPPSSFLVPR